MITIEEAWAKLHPSSGRVYNDREFASQAERVRALALAAVEATMDCLKDGFIGYYELRKRIEKLGAEDAT